MAVLDVDELVPRTLRQPRRAHEVLDQPVEVVVGEQAHSAREAAVEDRMVVGDQRLRAILDVRAREASGMRELQADVEVGVRVGAEALAVRGDQVLAQPGQALSASRDR